MVWNVLLILSVILVVALFIAGVVRDWDLFGVGIASAIIILAMFGTSLISSGSQQMEVSKYKRSAELVKMKEGQRDKLAKIIREELSAEKYAALMAATPDTDVLVILGNNASTLMVERARQLVDLNNSLFTMENSLEKKRIEICSYAENSYTPRLFTLSGCPDPIKLGSGGLSPPSTVMRTRRATLQSVASTACTVEAGPAFSLAYKC